MRKPESVLVDVDGTLADSRGRDHLLDMDRPGSDDWIAHSLACGQDPPVENNVRMVRVLHKHYNIVLCSGRSEVARLETEDWCLRHGVPWDVIHLRKVGDRTNNATYKVNAARSLEAMGFVFVLAIEDYFKSAKALTQHGIPCILVASFTAYGNQEDLLELTSI